MSGGAGNAGSGNQTFGAGEKPRKSPFIVTPKGPGQVKAAEAAQRFVDAIGTEEMAEIHVEAFRRALADNNGFLPYMSRVAAHAETLIRERFLPDA